MTAKLDFISEIIVYMQTNLRNFVKAAADLKEIDDGDFEDTDETAQAQDVEEEEEEEYKGDDDEGGKFFFWC